MANDVAQEDLMAAIRALIVGVDLATTTIGSLRADVERKLGLSAGALDERKSEMSQLINAAIAESQEAEQDEEEQAAHEDVGKKAKKSKREEKEKDEKKKKKKDKEKKQKNQQEPPAKKNKVKDEEPVVKRETDEVERTVDADAVVREEPMVPESEEEAASLDAADTTVPVSPKVEPNASGRGGLSTPPAAEPTPAAEPSPAAEPTSKGGGLNTPQAVEPTSGGGGLNTPPAAEPTTKGGGLNTPQAAEPTSGGGGLNTPPVAEKTVIENKILLPPLDDCEPTLSADAPVVKQKSKLDIDMEGDGAIGDGGDMLEMLNAEDSMGPDLDSLESKYWALSGGEDGTLRLWNLEDWSCARVIDAHEGSVLSIAVDWQDMLALSAGPDGCKLWDLQHGKSLRTMAKSEVGCNIVVARRLITGEALGGCVDGSLQLWELESGEAKQCVPNAHPTGVWALDICWVRRRAASGGDTSFKIWDMQTWSCLHKVEGDLGGVMCMAVDWEQSDDLRALVGGGFLGADDRNLRLWPLETKKPLFLQGSKDIVSTMAVNWVDEQAITGCWDAQLRLWNLETRLATRTFKCEFGRVHSCAVDFENMTAICGSGSGPLHMLDLNKDKEVQRLEGHVGAVTALRALFA